MIETQQEKTRINKIGLISSDENNLFNELIQEKLKKSIKEKKKLLNLKDMGIIKTKTLNADDVGNILNNVDKSYGLNNNSFIPALEESEKFIKFMIKRFNLKIPNNYVITINKASKSTIGFFMPKEHQEHFINTTQDLNNINLNTLHLKTNSPYECLTHELVHFINYSNKIKDCSSNQYHNKHFKKQAELLLLSVEKTKKGYNLTTETEQFKKMLEEYKPNKEVYNICQNIPDKKKAGSRLKLYVCGCGVKVRVASEDFKGLCLECNTKFKRGEK